MNINEDYIIYCKDNYEVAVKDIIGEDVLIEVETHSSIDQLKNIVLKLDLPVKTDNFIKEIRNCFK